MLDKPWRRYLWLSEKIHCSDADSRVTVHSNGNERSPEMTLNRRKWRTKRSTSRKRPTHPHSFPVPLEQPVERADTELVRTTRENAARGNGQGQRLRIHQRTLKRNGNAWQTSDSTRASALRLSGSACENVTTRLIPAFKRVWKSFKGVWKSFKRVWKSFKGVWKSFQRVHMGAFERL